MLILDIKCNEILIRLKDIREEAYGDLWTHYLD